MSNSGCVCGGAIVFTRCPRVIFKLREANIVLQFIPTVAVEAGHCAQINEQQG